MSQFFDASKSLAAHDPDSTLTVVIETSQTKRDRPAKLASRHCRSPAAADIGRHLKRPPICLVPSELRRLADVPSKTYVARRDCTGRPNTRQQWRSDLKPFRRPAPMASKGALRRAATSRKLTYSGPSSTQWSA